MATDWKSTLKTAMITTLASAVAGKAVNLVLDKGGVFVSNTLAKARHAKAEVERKKKALAEQAGKSIEIDDTPQ